jgi:hypothetical protein
MVLAPCYGGGAGGAMARLWMVSVRRDRCCGDNHLGIGRRGRVPGVAHQRPALLGLGLLSAPECAGRGSHVW